MTAVSTRRRLMRAGAAAVALATAVTLTACGTSDSLSGGGESTASSSGAITIGSQDYYSNEIIAEIYAQALEDSGQTVERSFRIGQRDVYMEALTSGEIQLIPDYTGNLLQFYDADTELRSSEEVAAALPDALPDGISALEAAPAQDADSYNVSAEFSSANGITSLTDLADYDGTLTVGGNAELESRPYGPDGLKELYGVDVDFAAIGDSGGPLTKQAILDDDIQLGDIYSADPDLAGGDFVTLDDPENLLLAQNVVPVVDDAVADRVTDVLAPVNAALTTDELIALNAASVNDQKDAATIATDWLTSKGLLG
ncbi:ABC transporter substrate-binding protein [Mycetocola reblochoni]|uniref:L-proline glycine betaine binding ABC transporter protein ProX (TC 3.A.1.12.1) n=2 Tax=Mycetocola reblochoni TaxID=331618 RepID=A0A1R4IIF7_9MICO|nr:ABC transporter substrate-binding protein [Mycetocola reblochoni]RLP69665.1 ABC transporter substrate-binding protein [Mycetocola reblochoni]SJN19607.1 L-proline glycine betaine binding ABC transporter protein ProX (TC 3.A.1.12.1) [Mycetocola reblochoni REB411]